MTIYIIYPIGDPVNFNLMPLCTGKKK